MKKQLSILLALLMLSSPFALTACGESAENSDAPAAADQAVTADPSADAAGETETEDKTVKTALPEDLDFGGAAYRIQNIECNSYYDTLTAHEQTGDKLNDAIYMRDAKLMDTLNFVFEEIKVPNDSAVGSIRSIVSAGDDAFDQYVSVDWRGYTLAQEGFALPISALPYVDVNREYWSQSIHKDMSIRGKLYYAFGDHNLSTYDSVNTLLFNKAMAEDLGLENHYQLVLEGRWTLDLMQDYMMKATSDTNGDGAWTEADTYGITSHSKQVLPCFWVAAGLRCVEKNEEDVPYFALEGNEKFEDLYQRILSMMHNDHLLFMSDNFPDYANNTLFIGGGALYNIVRVAFLHFYRDMDIDYGIIPYPKYDDAQETYYSRTEGAYIHIYPITLTQYDLAGAVTEAMACASLNEVIPVYYDEVLKSKYTRDENSTAMLDLIYGNRFYDLGDTLFCSVIRDGVFAGKFKSNDTNLQSTIKGLTKVAQRTIDKYVEAFDALEAAP